MGQKKRDDIFFFNAAPHQNVVEFMPAAGDWPCTTPTPSLLAMAPLPLIIVYDERSHSVCPAV